MIEGPAGPEDMLRRDGVLMIEQGGRGGVADYTGCLVRALAERGIPVTVATAADHRYEPIPGVRVVPVFQYVRGHSRLARLVRRLALGPLVNGLRFLAAAPRLTALARHRAIVHMQGWERVSIGIVGTLALRVARVPIVYTAHNTFERKRGARLRAALVFPWLSRATIVHTESDREILGSHTYLIPHGTYAPLAEAAADPARYREELGLSGEDPVVLIFGVLRVDKGIDDLLLALPEAPGWRAVIAGEDHGALAASAKHLADPALDGRVTVHPGFQEVDAVTRFFAASDLVALPYHQASQSGVLHLAYGYARPVVAYPVGGLPDAIVEGETGWLCEQSTPGALAAVLREAGAAGRTEMRRRGEEARRWATEQFAWGPIAAATEAVYVDALRSTAARKSSQRAA